MMVRQEAVRGEHEESFLRPWHLRRSPRSVCRVVLDTIQQPSSVAFTTGGARVGDPGNNLIGPRASDEIRLVAG